MWPSLGWWCCCQVLGYVAAARCWGVVLLPIVRVVMLLPVVRVVMLLPVVRLVVLLAVVRVMCDGFVVILSAERWHDVAEWLALRLTMWLTGIGLCYRMWSVGAPTTTLSATSSWSVTTSCPAPSLCSSSHSQRNSKPRRTRKLACLNCCIRPSYSPRTFASSLLWRCSVFVGIPFHLSPHLLRFYLLMGAWILKKNIWEWKWELY